MGLTVEQCLEGLANLAGDVNRWRAFFENASKLYDDAIERVDSLSAENAKLRVLLGQANKKADSERIRYRIAFEEASDLRTKLLNMERSRDCWKKHSKAESSKLTKIMDAYNSAIRPIGE